MRESDWSFVIKLHALFESIYSSLLLFHFNEPNLKEIFFRLELSNTTTGKLAFLKETGLLDSIDRKYILSLSELRNKLVHDIRHYDISLKEMLNNFDKNQLEKFAISFSPFESIIRKAHNLQPLPDHKIINLKKHADINNLVKRAMNDPKFHIWLGAYSVLCTIADMYGYSNYIQAKKAEEMLHEDREMF